MPRVAVGDRRLIYCDIHSSQGAPIIVAFRSGSLGRITLETPGEFSQWLAEGRKLDAERQARKDLLTRQGHIRRKNTAPGSRPRQLGKGGSARGR